MKKAYVFDMDGLIVNSEKYYHRQRLNFLKSQGLNPGVSELKYFADHKSNYANYVHDLCGRFLEESKSK